MDMKPFSLVFISLVLLASCSIEKRHYRGGFYVDRKNDAVARSQSKGKCEAAIPATPQAAQKAAPVVALTQSVPGNVEVPVKLKKASALSRTSISAPKSSAQTAVPDPKPKKQADDPVAEKSGKAAGILLLTGLGMMLLGFLLIFNVNFNMDKPQYYIGFFGLIAGWLVFLGGLITGLIWLIRRAKSAWKPGDQPE